MTGQRDKHTERDAAIVAKRKEGRTLRSLAQEFGLSFESIRRIECGALRREQEAADGVIIDLSVRTLNGIQNATPPHFGPIKDNYGPLTRADEPELIRRVLAIGRDAMAAAPNMGKKSLAEIDAWLASRGVAWS
jgi:hypothetical protein